jgi:hypothetical protein
MEREREREREREECPLPLSSGLVFSGVHGTELNPKQEEGGSGHSTYRTSVRTGPDGSKVCVCVCL